MVLQQLGDLFSQVGSFGQYIYFSIPGSNIVYKYIKNSHQNDPFRTILELLLLLFLAWYFLSKKSRPEGDITVKLSEQEIQKLIDDWEPEPLVEPLSNIQKSELDKLVIIQGSPGIKIKLADGKDRINFSSFNFLGIMNNDKIKEKGIEALRKYGVGSCGPPGFYGTLDVHIELEQFLAKFIGVEAAIIYSQGFSCISSAIPAFAKRGDIIVADEAVGFAVQKGLQISRSIIRYFKHNDMDDLENVLKSIEKEETRKNRKLTRRFLIVEGLYMNIGDICPLPELVMLKEKYKYRLIVEESMSFGVLGARGAGVSEHFAIDPNNIDIIAASMSNSLSAAGGFCAGSLEIVDHQRLSGQAYTFSASLPAILAVTALEALKLLKSDEDHIITRLHENTKIMHSFLSQLYPRMVLKSVKDLSPIFHLSLPKDLSDEAEKILQDIVDLVLKEGVLIVKSKYINNQEQMMNTPSIRICVSAGHTKRETEKAGTVIRDCAKKCLKRH